MTEPNSGASASLNAVTGFYPRWRIIKDNVARYGVIVGGLSIIAAIMLIFFYLLYVVWPLFIEPSAESVAHYPVPERGLGDTAMLAVEEQNEVGVRFTENGRIIFFAAPTGKTLLIHSIVLPESARISSFADGGPEKGVAVYGLSDGRAIVLKHKYNVSYPENRRVITPVVDYPLGREPLVLDDSGQALEKIAVRVDDDQTTVVAKTSDKRMILTSFEKKRSLFDDDEDFERTDSILDVPALDIAFILMDKDQRNLYLADSEGRLSFFDIADKSKPVIRQHLNVIEAGRKLTSMVFLNGSISLLIGDSGGLVSQWSVVRDARNNPAMQKIRSFKVSEQAIAGINAEQRRKGFIALDTAGVAGIYNTTAERELIKTPVSNGMPKTVSMSPRANAFIVESESGFMDFWSVENDHPEVSVKSLWQKVWYESYPKPDYIWQSSSASNDFEPKYSLTPLVFGTLKAAFYAMLIAVPLALMGAVYTAYFMAPRMRTLVKPGIEIMEALPTVILGFLAGLWLAPFVEEHLAGIFTLLLAMPLAVLVFAYLWQLLPDSVRHKIPDGWDAALLIPIILLSGWFAFLISVPLESWLFGGSLRHWLDAEWGIGYDQRNALVVGLAMGFAIIPTIFSIAEDAIFSVPKHLTVGSLALGATPWQTMTRVVLLTASPGIFSAIMIGLGRAVGETMIVLMATGNTPVMDLSIFQGMRTLSANIAVEMPESEVDSTHYRVLFLAALVLFLFTFVVNTLAELIRQRLREKYSSL
ncbi:ABC transporter permease subunit [Methylotuvimicrobium buryatense]|uniref:ABC transporter permease subunit n=1 Tax=Methylotuvimicrobium buryatense TaxID=95641 RepID=A0A4P9UR43_METBY|nr:ABC transporter permease subunit [Methylotuvimicrobium buryatense]QCW83013.1 ABC transporter permease subunit [Methylotuvimicrobium buryatense]